MKNLFNKIKEKINIKLLAILPSLFLFTGCVRSGPKYLHIKFNMMNLNDLSEYFAEQVEKMGLGFIQGINSLFASLMRLFYSLPDKNASMSIKNLESFSSFFKIVTVVQVLALVYIIICYAKSVATNNLMAQGSSTSAITHLKKVGVALIATFLVPYICVTCYMASIYAASALPSILKVGDDNTTDIWNVYVDMEKDGVRLSTYCKEGQELYGISDLTGLSSPETFNDLNVPESTKSSMKYAVIPRDYKGGKYCDEYSRNVFEHFQHSQYKKTLIVGADIIEFGVLGDIINYNVTTTQTVFMSIMGIVFAITFFLILAFFIFSSFKRVVDLLILMAMSWYYIGASVSDSPNENSLSSLWKKLLAICLTNFILMFEFLIWVSLVVDGDRVFTLPSLIYSIIWLLVLTSTPTVVENMVISTNTADQAAGLAQGGVRAVFNHLINR